MTRGQRARRGQSLVMVTLALFAMCGLLGLAVDFGWAFFVKRAAQRTADAAALAAAHAALEAVGMGGTFACGGQVGCQGITNCPASPGIPASDNLQLGCAYAKKNGFYTTGNNGKQTVSVEAAVTPVTCTTASPPNCIPYAPGVAAYYYVTVRVAESVPQLFSAVLGNPTAIVASRATAAVIDTLTIGSLILLKPRRRRFPRD